MRFSLDPSMTQTVNLGICIRRNYWFLCDARFFVTKRAVIGLAEKACRTEKGDLIVAFKGASVESVFATRRARGGRFELINGVYQHFSTEEQSAHEKLVEGSNSGTLETEKLSLV